MMASAGSASTTKKRGKKVDSTWMKNHPLEGDDIILGFYDLLCKRNPKTMKPCRNVYVPDTVVFEHNFPRGWYTTDVKAREVMRKQGKELDAATIEAGFKRSVHENFPTVAVYLSTLEKDIGDGVTETTTEVEVLNKDDINSFLARKNKREGILQRFVYPKGYHNSVIKVVWSPRICIAQRRTNKYPISDRKRAENDPFAISVTYEGPEFLSNEGTVSAHVAFEVKQICSDIVTHFYYTEHKYITRMVLYFKSDVKDRLWLLWCGSLRIAERKSPSELPVNLATKFAEPERENDLTENDILRMMDQAYFLVTRDEFFYETFIRGTRYTSSGRSAIRQNSLARSPNARITDVAIDIRPKAKAESNEKVFPPEVNGAIETMQDQEEAVLEAMRDVYYKAYSHFLTLDPSPFDLVVPYSVAQILTESRVVDLMRKLKLQPKVQLCTTENDQNETEDASLVYIIPPNFKSPLTKLIDDTEVWVRQHFATLIESLKQHYTSGSAYEELPWRHKDVGQSPRDEMTDVQLKISQDGLNEM